MLIVNRVGEDAHRYFFAAIRRGEAPGTWVGTGSQALVDTGLVPSAGALAPLLHGCDPASGERLTPRHCRRLPALGLTFAAPKSVSLAHGIALGALQAALRDAHVNAVAATLDYLERNACKVRRAQSAPLDAQGFVGAAFLHRISRAHNPHLHTHVIVVNAAAGPDGRWSALWTPPLFAECRGADALYRAHLRHELSAGEGIGWERGELGGVPRHVIEAFSQPEGQRRSTGRSAVPDHDVLVDGWRERAERLGFDLAHLHRGERHRGVPDLAGIIESLALERDTFSRSEVVKATAERVLAGAPARTIEALADGLLRSRDVVAVSPYRYSTEAAVLARHHERAVLDPRALRELIACADRDRRAVVVAVPSLSRARWIEGVTGITAAGVSEALAAVERSTLGRAPVVVATGAGRASVAFSRMEAAGATVVVADRVSALRRSPGELGPAPEALEARVRWHRSVRVGGTLEQRLEHLRALRSADALTPWVRLGLR